MEMPGFQMCRPCAQLHPSPNVGANPSIRTPANAGGCYKALYKAYVSFDSHNSSKT